MHNLIKKFLNKDNKKINSFFGYSQKSSQNKFGTLNFSKRKIRGFTLLETIVAIFILMLSITGPMVMAQNGLRAAYLSRDQITAFFLVQDSMEYVKNIKDDFGLGLLASGTGDPGDWLQGLVPCLDADGCTMDVSGPGGNPTVDICNGSQPGCIIDDETGGENDIPLNILFDDGVSYLGIGDSNNDPSSIFARTTYIEETQSGKEMKVTVKVRWKSYEGLGYREIKATEYMTNWIGNLAN